MQDEVTKHTRKIFSIMKSGNHTLSGKTKEILVEILIIVFAVTISIWLHSWSQHNHQQNEVKEFLADIRADINDNLKTMNGAKETLANSIASYSYLANLEERQYDSLVKTPQGDSLISKKMEVNILIRRNANGNYEGFKSSGKIGYIENKKLKKLILSYYQRSIPALVEVDSYYNQTLKEVINYYIEEAKRSTRENLFDPRFKTRIALTRNTAEGSKRSYEVIIEEAKELIAEIDKEMQE